MDDKFVEAISDFLAKIERGGLSDQQVSAMMSDLKLFAPHSDLSDIIFYGERDRTAKEIAAEAMLREQLWAEGGKDAVISHIEGLMRTALANPAIDTAHKYSALNILEGIEQAARPRRPS